MAGAYGQARNAVFAWGMGMTHHVHGVANVEAIANLALLRGMIGKRFAGLLPLRGHSNVQGIGTIGVKPVLARDVLRRMEEAFGVTFPEEKGLDTMACMQKAAAGDIDAAVIMGGNLWAATPDTAFSTRARRCTSLATTAKPLPASPARAASMMALTAKSLVCLTICRLPAE